MPNKKNSPLSWFEVDLFLHGRTFTLKKSARSYYDLVKDLNKEFGSVLILRTRDSVPPKAAS